MKNIWNVKPVNFDEQMEKAKERVGYKIDPFKDEYETSLRKHVTVSGNPIEKVVGEYDIGRGIRMVITTEPIEVLMKSLGRRWVSQSCERLDPSQACKMGPFGDIETASAIVLFYRNGENEPFARTMIRWCETPDGIRDIGIEPKFYPLPGTSMRDFDVDYLYKKLVEILEKAGFCKYEVCRTPYRVKGYSHMGEDEYGYDSMNVKISYKPWWKKELRMRYRP